MPTVLITGAGRGIGFEHARQYAARGWRVLATSRRVDERLPLGALACEFPDRVVTRRMDVCSEADVSAVADEWREEEIDVLLDNAGTYGPKGAPEGMGYQSLEGMDYGIWREILEVNLLGAFRVAVAFRPHLSRGSRHLLVMMSSDLGSIASNQRGGSYAYRSSKAGLNMITRGMAVEWIDLTVIGMAPGWTRTDLGGATAPILVEESVRMQQVVFDRVTPDDTGRLLNRFGEVVPW